MRSCVLLLGMLVWIACGPLAIGQQPAFDSDLLSINQSMPALVTVDDPFEVKIEVTGKREARDIVITSELPEGATIQESVPQAEVTDNQVSWLIHSLQAGQVRAFRMRLVAANVGALQSCVSVSATGTACVSTQAGRPVLLVRKVGPDSAIVGQQATYVISVENVGTSTARDIVVTDKIPSGLAHESGQEALVWHVDELAPNRSVEFTVPLTAVKRGKYCNEAEVTAASTKAVTAKSCTEILMPTLKISKVGPAKQIIGRQARYTIKVENSGDTTFRDLTVVDMLPAGTQLVSAPGSTVKGNKATWQLALLNPGESVELSVLLSCTTHGQFCNRAEVTASNGLRDSAEVCTEWIGHAGLLLEVVDTADPLQVGDETEYLIMVKNQGSAADSNILIKAIIPEQLEILSFSGSSEGKREGQVVTFSPFPVLSPQEEASWKIKAKGRSAGDARLRVEMSSALLEKPVPEEESTYVY